MSNNTANTQENIQENTNKMAWEKPVLYKENWLNTLSGEDPGIEGLSPGNVDFGS